MEQLMEKKDYSWDFFLAHSGGDKVAAESLYDLLTPHSKVFLDCRCLLLGDNWDQELALAQARSMITVVLISTRTNSAYYQREEIARAISMARENEGKHRVVPVFLDGHPLANSVVPYGLRLKHGLSLTDVGGIIGVAHDLLELQKQLKGRLPEASEQETRETKCEPSYLSHQCILDIASVIEPYDCGAGAEVRFSITNNGLEFIKITSIQLELLSYKPYLHPLHMVPEIIIDEYFLHTNINPNTPAYELLPKHHILKSGETDGFFLKIDAEEGIAYDLMLSVMWNILGNTLRNKATSSVFKLAFPIKSIEGLIKLTEFSE